MTLKTHHILLLRGLIDQPGGTPVSELDGRLLRPLRTKHLVSVRGGIARITPGGIRCLAEQQDQPALRATGSPVPSQMSPQQADVLWQLHRQREPMPSDHVDGRVLRALRVRGLLVERDGQIELNEHGHRAAEGTRHGKPRSRRGATAVSGRAQAILRALEQLEQVLPSGAEVEVGAMFAAADDVIQGFRNLARRVERASKQSPGDR